MLSGRGGEFTGWGVREAADESALVALVTGLPARQSRCKGRRRAA